MKRFAWLLLALSLPALATINGVDSSRILIPCTEGQRMGEYPAGGACNPPALVLYHQDFESLNASQSFMENANLYGDASRTLESFAHVAAAGNCNNTITIATDKVREAGGAQSIKFVNDFAASSDTGCSGGSKARVELKMASDIPKFSKYVPDTEGDYGEWNFGSERWFGFSLYFPTAGNAKWNNRVTRPIFFQIFGWGATVGDGASPILHFMLDNGGEVDIDTEFSVDAGDLTSAQDYLYTGGWVRDTNGNTLSGGAWEILKTYGSSGAAYHLKNAASATAERIQRDQWNDFVVHFKKGHTIATGLIEVWLNGTKILDIPAFPTAPDDFWQSFVKNGLYGVRVDGGGTYTMYMDSYRATDETGDFDAVDPTQDGPRVP